MITLNDHQKHEIAQYISKSVKYKETYLELLDHLITKIEEQESKYDINILRWVIRSEFGSLAKVEDLERAFLWQLKWNYLKKIILGMIKTFMFPTIIINFLILLCCFMVYNSALLNFIYLKFIYFGLLSFIYFSSYFWLIKEKDFIYLKIKKASMKTEVSGWLVFLPIGIINILMVTILHQTAYFSIPTQNKIILSAFFITSIYALSFIKIYQKDIKDILS